MIKLEKKKSCIIWILMTVICTFFVCMIGNVSVEAKTVTKDITIGKGKTYAIEQTFSGKATFKTSNKKIAVIKNGKIIGKSIGKAKITIKDKGNTYIYKITVATVYKGNIIKNLIMDCQSYTKYRPNETTGGIFVSWRRKEELPTGA